MALGLDGVFACLLWAFQCDVNHSLCPFFFPHSKIGVLCVALAILELSVD